MEWLPVEIVGNSRWLQRLSPAFSEHYKRIVPVIDKIFRRRMDSKKLEDICVFALGYLSVEDFMEILLLCSNGYGLGGVKLLRAMYEHHVTGAYLAKFPQVAKAFTDYYYIATRKFFNRAAEFKDLEPLLESLGGVKVREENRKNAERVENDFVTEVCKKCHATGIQFSWSKLATDAMAREVSPDLFALYGPNFLVPTWHLHSSFSAIASRQDPDVPGLTFSRPQDEYIQQALSSAHGLLPDVLALQSGYFKLQLDEEIEVVKRSFSEVWNHV